MNDTTLAEVLRDPGHWDWRSFLFLPPRVEWTLESLALVAPEDSVAEDESHPEATRLGLQLAFSMSEVQSIRRNLLAQVPNATDADLLRALAFYFDNDAFIAMDGI